MLGASSLNQDTNEWRITRRSSRARKFVFTTPLCRKPVRCKLLLAVGIVLHALRGSGDRVARGFTA
jgi:hypothetical protein